MARQSKQVKESRRIFHKVYIALMLHERNARGMHKTEVLSYNTVLELEESARLLAAKIQPIYQSKNGAGALWLDRKMQDSAWLLNQL